MKRGAVAAMGALGAAVVAAGCATVGPLPPARVSGWYQLTTPGFVVTTNLPAATGRELIRELELLRRGIWGFVWPSYRPPRAQMQVVAMSLGEVKDFQQGNVSGFRSYDELGSLMVVSVDRRFQWSTTAHEMAHELSAWMWPFEPLWLAEGLFTYLETIEHASAGDTFTFGRSNGRRLGSLLTRGVMPTARLLSQPSIIGDPDLGWFEDSAWLLFHYLVNRHPGALGRFQERLVRLEPWRQAWRAELPGLTTERLDAQLEEYLRRSGYLLLVKPLAGGEPPKPSGRALSAAQAHAALARLRMQGGPDTRDTARGTADTARALALDPDAVLPLAVSFYHLPDATPARRRELAARATRAHPESWLAWMMAADASGGEDRARTRDALDRARRLAPEEPRIWQRLAVIEAEAGRWQEAVACSNQALRLGTPWPQLLAVHAAASFKLGKCAVGADAAAAFAQIAPPGSMASAREQLAALASGCVEGGSPAAAQPP